MSVTMKQIAEELGVSQPLVTYALNDRPGVSEAMRAKIKETAARMGYSRASNIEAQFLIARRYGKRPFSGVIALVYPLVRTLPGAFSTPYSHDIIEGIEHEIRDRNLDLLITPTCGERIPRIISERRVDGVMFLSDISELNPLFCDLELPAVSVCTWNETTHNMLPDDEAGGYLATTHLLELGHRRIAFTGVVSFQGNARYEGYKRALSEYRVSLDEKIVVRPQLSFCREEDGLSSMKLLLARARRARQPSFTAIICQNDMMAIGAVGAAQEAGLNVPEEMSVVGFDDVSALYHFKPRITSLSYSRQTIGRESVGWLCTEIAALGSRTERTDGEPYRTPYGIRTFPMSLAIRDTTAPPSKPTG